MSEVATVQPVDPDAAENVLHASDCAINNGPALPIGPCNCGAVPNQAPESFLARVKAEVAKIAHDIGVEEAHIIDLLKAHL